MSSLKSPNGERITSLQRIMQNKGIEKSDRSAEKRSNHEVFQGNWNRSFRGNSISPSKTSMKRKSNQNVNKVTNLGGNKEIFGRSALIQSSFFPKNSRPLTKSPIYEHSPFLNKLLLYDHQANAKKNSKKNKSKQNISFGADR